MNKFYRILTETSILLKRKKDFFTFIYDELERKDYLEDDVKNLFAWIFACILHYIATYDLQRFLLLFFFNPKIIRFLSSNLFSEKFTSFYERDEFLA